VIAMGMLLLTWLQAAPNAYSVEFENAWVRVTRVIYPPHANLPVHAHNALASAYVYLNDGPPVIFKHFETDYGPMTRPATKAGAVRLYRGVKEQHAVENTGDTRSEFLRVEFKTEPLDDRMLFGRFYPLPESADSVEKVQFENRQVRMSRIRLVPGASLAVTAEATTPTLLIALMAGAPSWVPSGSTHRLSNTGAAAIEWLRFDLKTTPIK